MKPFWCLCLCAQHTLASYLFIALGVRQRGTKLFEFKLAKVAMFIGDASGVCVRTFEQSLIRACVFHSVLCTVQTQAHCHNLCSKIEINSKCAFSDGSHLIYESV